MMTMTREQYDKLPPHVQRMCDEAVRLGSDIEKMRAFMETPRFSALDADRRNLMYLQAAGMTTHAYALGKRLNLEGVV